MHFVSDLTKWSFLFSSPTALLSFTATFIYLLVIDFIPVFNIIRKQSAHAKNTTRSTL
jgi:preprotein translocase subunit YajC